MRPLSADEHLGHPKQAQAGGWWHGDHGGHGTKLGLSGLRCLPPMRQEVAGLCDWLPLAQTAWVGQALWSVQESWVRCHTTVDDDGCLWPMLS